LYEIGRNAVRAVVKHGAVAFERDAREPDRASTR